MNIDKCHEISQTISKNQQTSKERDFNCDPELLRCPIQSDPLLGRDLFDASAMSTNQEINYPTL